MSVPVHCPKCGYSGVSRLIEIRDAVEVTFSNVTETCPRCGGRAVLQAGTYDFVGSMITAFRAPGMTRQKIEAFRSVVQRANDGIMPISAAVESAAQIDPLLSRLLRIAFENGITFDRVLAVLLAIQSFWTSYSSDADVQAALAESRHQTELSQKMLSELIKLNESSHGQPTTKSTQQPGPAKTSAPRNRHERRKAEALGRKS